MKTRLGIRFLSFLFLSVLLLWGGIAGAVEKRVAVGEMVSQGVVQFEAKKEVWKAVDGSYFPLFSGMKVRTEKGAATVTLQSGGQVEIGSQSLFYLDGKGRLILEKGSLVFRNPAGSEVEIGVKDLMIRRHRGMQATRGDVVGLEKGEGVMGAVSVEADGRVGVKSLEGRIGVWSKERGMLAEVTAPEAVTVSGGGKEQVAQAGEAESGKYLGLSAEALAGIGVGGAAVLGGIGWGISDSTSGGGGTNANSKPICP